MDYSAMIVAVLGSGLLSTIVTQIISAINKRRDKKSGMTAGIRLIIKDRVRYLAVKYIDQGWIYVDELEDIVALWGCYHNELNGNGFLDSLMAQVKALPVRGVHH